jgi:putative hemolysin
LLQILTRPTIDENTFAPIRVNGFVVRLAESAGDLEAAQTLRYDIFYRQMGATASPETAARERDFDRYDDICDHLLVIDETDPEAEPRIVGTYRLLRRSVANRHGGFYSADEFDLGRVENYPGEILEVGRSCVDAAYRSRAVMQLLWKGIAAYVTQHDVGLLFGCASFHGSDPTDYAEYLSYLHHYHLAPERCRPVALPARYCSMDLVAKDDINPVRALAKLPPLFKGYLRLNGFVGDGAVIDHQFNTVDICMLVEMKQVSEKYYRHYIGTTTQPDRK